jgi:hypothetical protein
MEFSLLKGEEARFVPVLPAALSLAFCIKFYYTILYKRKFRAAQEFMACGKYPQAPGDRAVQWIVSRRDDRRIPPREEGQL